MGPSACAFLNDCQLGLCIQQMGWWFGVFQMEEGEVTESEVGELVAASSMQSLTPTQCRVGIMSHLLSDAYFIGFFH